MLPPSDGITAGGVSYQSGPHYSSLTGMTSSLPPQPSPSFSAPHHHFQLHLDQPSWPQQQQQQPLVAAAMAVLSPDAEYHGVGSRVEMQQGVQTTSQDVLDAFRDADPGLLSWISGHRGGCRSIAWP